jgi:hypothetical protein
MGNLNLRKCLLSRCSFYQKASTFWSTFWISLGKLNLVCFLGNLNLVAFSVLAKCQWVPYSCTATADSQFARLLPISPDSIRNKGT